MHHLQPKAFTPIAQSVALALTLTLGACASPRPYSLGIDLVARGQLEAGVEQLSIAARANPRDVEVRTAYLLARDRWVSTELERAERELALGRFDLAEPIIRRLIAREPDASDKARQLLELIARKKKQFDALNEVGSLIDRGDLDLARIQLAVLKREYPADERVVAYSKTLERVQAPRTLTETALARAAKRTVTLDFRDAQLQQIFEVLSKVSGVNFVMDREIKLDQKVSINLRNTSIESAMHAVLLTNQLEYQALDGNTVLIYPNTAAKTKMFQELSVRAFNISNADVRILANSIRTMVRPRELIIDERQNILIIRDTAEGIRLAERLIALQDVAEAEVILEVEVLEVSRNRLRELGVSFPDKLILSPLASSTGSALTLADLQRLSGATIGATVSPLTLNARSELLEARILANPRIRALNREKAKVLVGNKVPSITSVITATGIVSESVNYLDVGLKLEVEPTIHAGNDVLIRLGLEVSNIINSQVTKNGTTTYTIGTRGASTTLRLRDGENQMLAGLISDEERNSGNSIPGLADLPVAGRLFQVHTHLP
jgi:general secretion pathway protein D